MYQLQVISSRVQADGERIDANGVVKKAYSMLIVDGVFSGQGMVPFSCELTLFEGRARKGVPAEPLPVVKEGEVYEVVPKFRKGRDGKLVAEFALKPQAAAVRKAA